MRSLIFQISNRPLTQSEWASEDVLVNLRSKFDIDYVITLKGNERKRALKKGLKKVLPSGLFTFNADDCSLTYNGGIDEWCKHFVYCINLVVNSITPENVIDMKDMGIYNLDKLIFGYGKYTQFVSAECDELFGLVDFMKYYVKPLNNVGDKLYISGVYSCHF